MSNTLIKDTRITYTPGVSGVVGDPGQPYMPAYTSYEQTQVCGFNLRSGGGGVDSISWVFVPDDPETGTPAGYEMVSVPPTGLPVAQSARLAVGSGYSCQNVSKPVYHPAQAYVPPVQGVPPTPEQLVSDFNLGWNSGARSIGVFRYAGRVKFNVGSVTGAVVGLNGEDAEPDYAEIDHGFYFDGTYARVLENGQPKFFVGTYAITDVFQIDRRANGTVNYFRQGTLVYTSATPSVGDAFLDASLYSGGDTVDNPSIQEIWDIYLTALPPQAVGGTGVLRQAVLTALPATLSAGMLSRGTLVTLPAVVFASNYARGEAILTTLPATLAGGYGALAPSYALASLIASPCTIAAHGLTGVIGQVVLTALPMTLLASNKVYGEARLTMLPPILYGSAYEGSYNATLSGFVNVRDNISINVVLLADFTSRGQLNSLAAMVIGSDVDMVSHLGVLSFATVRMTISGKAYSRLMASFGIPVDFDSTTTTAWVVNTDSAATSSYENYGFNSFGIFDGQAFGCRADGIYVLGGDNDAGMAIRSSMNFGKRDFQASMFKRVSECYLGISSSDKMFLKVRFNGEEYLYTARSSDENLRVQRVDMGRGIRTNYIEFELYNNNGSRFELDTVEFQVLPLSRRI